MKLYEVTFRVESRHKLYVLAEDPADVYPEIVAATHRHPSAPGERLSNWVSHFEIQSEEDEEKDE